MVTDERFGKYVSAGADANLDNAVVSILRFQVNL